MKKINYFNAFTLSEIVTAMVIIGILMAICIPTINKSYQRNSMQTTFVDILRQTNKALFQYTYKKPAILPLERTDLFKATADKKGAAEKLSIQYSSKVGAGNDIRTVRSGTKCWGDIKIFQNIDSKGTLIDMSAKSCFTDQTGRIFATDTFAPDASGNVCVTNLYAGGASNPPTHKLQHSCGLLYVDLNGTKSPNTFGKDVFIFVVTNSSPNFLYPVGGELLKNDALVFGLDPWKGNSCGENNSKEGRTCAGRIIEEGMKIKYWK